MNKYTIGPLTFAVMSMCSTLSYAIDLRGEFLKSQNFDPAYQTAKADYKSSSAMSSQSFASLLPSANLSSQRIETDTGSRFTASVSQPLFNLSLLAQYRQGSPRQAYAESNLKVQGYVLQTKLLKAANAIVTAKENIKLNEARLDAYSKQEVAASRKLDMGQGLITDLRDIQVKTAQAKALMLSLQTVLKVALSQYAAITGELPNNNEFAVTDGTISLDLKSVEEYVSAARLANPAILVSRYLERIAELESTRAKSALLPSVSATYQKSQSNNVANDFVAVIANFPINASSIIGTQVQESNYLKAKETTRDTEERTRVEIERVLEQVQTGVEMLKVQKQAISAAGLSLEANTKSYEGGVRTVIDVLNASQTLFQVKSDFVSGVTSLSENYLNLMQLANEDQNFTLESVSTKFFK